MLKQAAEAVEARLPDRDYAVVITGLEEWSVAWAVRIWVKTEDYWPTRDVLMRKVKTRLDAAGIGIAVPRREVRMHDGDAEPDAGV